MLHKDTYPDLEPIVRGSTWKKLFDWFYRAGMLRYCTKKHLNELSGQFGTNRKLVKLVESQYLTAFKDLQVFAITDKIRKLLKAEGYNTEILQAEFNGTGDGHELAVSSALVKIMKEPHFYAAFYYDFGFVRPDSVVIHKKDNAYKITMLEVEEEKENQLKYLKDKRDKYNKLAQDEEIYSKWWKVWSERLDLPFCKQDKFCFGVLCNSKIQFEAEAWTWE